MEFFGWKDMFFGVQNGGYLKVGKNTFSYLFLRFGFTFMYFFVLRVIYSEVSSA